MDRQQITAKIVADSVTSAGVRLTTMQLKYHRWIHPEFLTHRVFSRNAGSSRAIPTAKLIEIVRNNPYFPEIFGKNMPGMQAKELLNDREREDAEYVWGMGAKAAASVAESLMEIGAHKQIVNRVLEPYLPINVVVTATDWDNFFSLRDHKDAQPEIQVLARAMKAAMLESKPRVLVEGEWHLPYVDKVVDAERVFSYDPSLDPQIVLRQISAARCARVSYKAFDGRVAEINEDMELFDKLVGSHPWHASPLEHQAQPDPFNTSDSLWGNFRGWVQWRKVFEQEMRHA